MLLMQYQFIKSKLLIEQFVEETIQVQLNAKIVCMVNGHATNNCYKFSIFYNCGQNNQYFLLILCLRTVSSIFL